MNKEEAIYYLFSIAKLIKRSFDNPVILITKKDYADCAVTSLVDMRAALLHRAAPELVVNIIRDFHLTWLEAISDIDNFKRQIKNTPRDTIITTAFDFTSDCAVKRLEYFQHYIDSIRSSMTLEEQVLIEVDLRAITDMNLNFQSALEEKQQAMRNIVDTNEYYNKIFDETEELMNWLDVLNDNLAIEFSNFVGVESPMSLVDQVSKTLQQRIEEVARSSNDINNYVDEEELQFKGEICPDSGDELEVKKIIEKIKDLENKIVFLKRENSLAIPALRHRAKCLRKRLDMIEDLRLSFTLKNKRGDTMKPNFKGDKHIFDHLLPKQDRKRLVEDLLIHWNDAVIGALEGNSIISILSVADIKESFCDDFGKFVIDKYGRKLYTSNLDNPSLYQVNEKQEFVPVSDDNKHVYFYDSCGRYYVNDFKHRVYKAHKTASEYILDFDGMLIKTKEIRNGKAYHYDSLGRYYFEENGKQIYLGEDGHKYEDDGLGNLVKIRTCFMYEMCSLPSSIPIEETKYLQRTIGEALKKSIADVILHQPHDPILFLAQSLENYQHQEQERQNRRKDEVELMAKRRERMRDLESLPTFPCPEGESYGVDYNLIAYNTPLF